MEIIQDNPEAMSSIPSEANFTARTVQELESIVRNNKNINKLILHINYKESG